MSIPTFSNRQNLGTVQPTPSISTREFTLEPGAPQTLKIVGTSVYVSQCYAVDAEGYQLPAACRITLGHSAPFLSETGTSVEFKYYGTPFNEITLESVGNERVFVVLQVGYMLECRKGDAGTAGAIAILREKIQQNREEIEKLLEQLDAIGPATSTTYGLVKYAAETVATNDNAPVLRNADGQMRVPVATTGQYGVFKLGTSKVVPNDAGVVGKTANGSAAVRFATTENGGVVKLANSLDDTRAGVALTPALAKAQFEAMAARIQELENALASMTTGAAMVLAETVDSGAQTLSVPLAGEDLNGEISVETNTDWLAADSTGEIQVEALS